MGVHGLWDLLAPVGRRVSVETLAGKRLAIDASIWMIQFMKAMRDEKGEMIRNAHLVGFFRRICKLLFLRTKPVFVFDGGTPALKRRTVIARRRQRENAQAKVRKTAEKLLLNQLRTMRLKELQEDIQNQRPKNDAKGKKVSLNEKNETVCKKIVLDEQVTGEHTSEKSNISAANYDQEALDAMLAASIAAEEGGSFAADASTSSAAIPREEEEDDDDEEMILPAMHGKVDPAILASLPPSMQLDLLVQMRERLMAENRQRYQKVKKAPARFSELQIQAYLKTVAFRREIDEVQKSAAGKGIGGVQTSRIASEANREFIFSSSFTGDKQVLASGRVENDVTHQSQAAKADISTNAVSESASFAISDHTADSFQEDAGGALPDDVETYLDERGRLRVSRVRAMGIRMTRDLQRNLDLMKEIEQERVVTGENVNSNASTDPNIPELPGDFPNSNPVSDALDQSNGIADANDNVEDSALKNGTSIEITFEMNAEQKIGDDDDLFAHLVAGEPLMGFSVDNSLRNEQSMDSTSDCEWEEGVVEGKVDSLSHETIMNSSLDAGGTCDDSGVDWEDGSPQILEEAFPSAECNGPPSKGALEEEAAFQEAIRRSLEDVKDPEIDISFENLEHNNHKESIFSAGAKAGNVNKDGGLGSAKDIYQPLELPSESESKSSTLDSEAKLNALSACDNSVSQWDLDVGVNPANMELPTESTAERCLKSSKDENRNVNLHGQIYENPNTSLGKEVNLIEEQLQDTSTTNTDVSTGINISSIATSLYEGLCDSTLADKKTESEATLDGIYHDTAVPRNMSPKGTASDVDVACKSSQAPAHDELHLESGKSNAVSTDNKDEQVQVTEAGLEEQLLILDEEYKQLGNEQKKLERNAESVSSEMFAECQELLQMFGLPYIIAPMEAEAQCAFMELANLVDGVVTDDSDAFLFGARSVYKNIFDDRKYVETYFMKDIENELGLDREKLIRMALLLGSDYTEGISGIGIVNAIEVVSAFPEEDGLRKFREWIESPDPAILGKFDAGEGCSSSKRGSKVGEIDKNSKPGVTTGDGSLSQSEGEIQKIKQIFMEKHRNVSKNWHIPSSFPSEVVISAYDSPQVDKSMDPFVWGKPDLFALRKVSWEKFGWGTKKADEVLLPVLKEYEKHETQLRLEAFYTFNERFAKIRSKRIKSTIKGITGTKSLEQIDDSSLDVPKSRKKRRNNPSEGDRGEAEKSSSVMKNGGAGENVVKMSSKKRKSQTEAEGSNPEASREANTSLIASNGLSDKRRGKERGRIQSTGKRKKRTQSCLEDAETSSDDGLTCESAETAEVEFEMPHQVRRSERPRKAVKYSMGDINSDDSDKAAESDGDPTDGDVIMKEASADQVIVGDSSSGADKHRDLGQEYPGDLLEADGEFRKESTEPTIEINQSKSSQYDDSPGEAQLSKEYRKMGGGFCLEDESDETPNQTVMLANDSAAPAEEENQGSDFSQSSAIPTSRATEQRNERPDANETEENKNETTCKDGSGFTGFPEDNNDDRRTNTTMPLRAMPNLRRRRKN